MKTSRSNPLRSDPSRTGSIRRKFELAIKGRFSAFRKKLIDLVVGENAFGITANARFQFHTDAQKLEEFRKWLGQNTDYILMGSSTKQIEENFWEQYIQEAYKQGQGRAFDDLNKPYARGYSQDNSTKDFYSGTKHQFLQQSFGQPETKEKIQLLAGRTFSELKGMSDGAIQVLSRNLVDGLARGDNPRTIAAQLEKTLGISENRALGIARTEIMRAHNEGALDAMEKMGVEEVGVMVEWSSADDSRVCPLCKPLDGIVLKISEARGMFPRHNSCRCSVIPAGVGEVSKKQKKSQTQIDTAIDESIEAEIPKKAKDRTVAEQKDLSKWQGADAKISQERPRSVLDGSIKGISQPTPLPIAVEPVVAPQRVVEAKAISAFDRPNVDKTLPLVEKLKSPELDAIRQHFIKTHEKGKQAPLLSKQIAEVGNEQHLLGQQLEDLDKRKKELGAKEYKKLYKQFEDEVKNKAEQVKQLQLDYIEAKKKQVMKFQDIIGIRDKERQLTVEAKTAHPVTTTKSSGPKFMTEVQSKQHRDKANQAAQFLTQVTGKRDELEKISVDAHQPPSDVRAFSRREGRPNPGIYVPKEESASIFTHELGHQLENQIKGAKELALAFREMRIQQSGTLDENLKKLFPDHDFGPDETGNKDDWEKVFGAKAAHYVGKTYSDGSTEIISMGVEKLMDDPISMAKKDPEYFNFIIGVLRGVL